ncbi:hypothetical protein [Nocardia asiatica]|uniref:hypothetical protein n=1 Tax=Nocardia asiatica TaxID=209252 RepID=UPI002456A01F|nr:hypothetical protein [Nocardia asiatica]
MTDRDIVDEIDQLVDTQLQQTPSGYDFNVNQENCRHCGGEWHGLKITQRMRDMRRRGVYDEEYRYADDDSTVLCPGSTYEGEFTPPENARINSTPLADAMLRQLVATATGISPLSPALDNLFATSSQREEPAPSTIIDMETVNRLRSMRVTASSPIGVRYYNGLFDYFEVEVARHFPGVQVDRADIQHEERPPLSPTAPAIIDMMWRPRSNEIELLGGPRHGETVTVDNVDRITAIPAVLPVIFRSTAEFNGTVPVELETIRYKRFGWNTATRRWVYSTDSDWRPECRYCRYERVRGLADKYCQGCMRDLIIAEYVGEGELYAQQRGIRRPIIATDDSYLRGMDLEMFRVHVVNWPADATQLVLRQMAERAGRPLESFYANTTEQAA